MVLAASYSLSLVLTIIVVEIVESSVDCTRNRCNGDCFWSYSQQVCKLISMSCGNHNASTCGECGHHRNMCNGDCSWSESQKTCEYRHNNELFTITLGIGYDRTFSEQMKGDKMAVKAIKKIIRDANKKMGPKSNLKPPVRLQVYGDIHQQNMDVPILENGRVTIPESLKSSRMTKPFVLITGKAEGGMARNFGNICDNIDRGLGRVVSSCNFLKKDYAYCSNVLVHEIGHLLSLQHDLDVGCPELGHMQTHHTKWSSCSNSKWQLAHKRDCLQSGTNNFEGLEELDD